MVRSDDGAHGTGTCREIQQMCVCACVRVVGKIERSLLTEKYFVFWMYDLCLICLQYCGLGGLYSWSERPWVSCLINWKENVRLCETALVSVQDISRCFTGLRMANFQQDLNDLINNTLNFTCVLQCFPGRTGKVAFPITLHYIVLYCTCCVQKI